VLQSPPCGNVQNVLTWLRTCCSFIDICRGGRFLLCISDLDNHVAKFVGSTFLVTKPINSTWLPSNTTMVCDNSFYQKETVALSSSNKNLKRTINVLFANVQAKGIAPTALNWQLIPWLLFVSSIKGSTSSRATKASIFRPLRFLEKVCYTHWVMWMTWNPQSSYL
jgi:hypothetical protein